MRYTGAAYRAHHPNWSWTPLSGEGARRYGGRFNRPGTPALYLSVTLETAIGEASQGFSLRFPPLTIVTYDVDCDDVADLTTPAYLKKPGITPAQLAGPWQRLAHEGEPVPTWLLAGRLIAAGYAGMLVRSFAPGATSSQHNLVLWRWGAELPHKIEVYDPDGRLKPRT